MIRGIGAIEDTWNVFFESFHIRRLFSLGLARVINGSMTFMQKFINVET
jgi:hypothetical protein